MKRTAKKRPPSQAEKDLQMIADVLSGGVGDYHLRALVEALARALNVEMAFIAQLAGHEGELAQTIACYRDGKIVENITYDLDNTPCADVLHGTLRLYPSRVQKLFPLDAGLKEFNAEGYAGIPLVDSIGRVLGLMAVISSRPFRNQDRVRLLLRIFGARAALELERTFMDQQIFRQITAAL